MEPLSVEGGPICCNISCQNLQLESILMSLQYSAGHNTGGVWWSYTTTQSSSDKSHITSYGKSSSAADAAEQGVSVSSFTATDQSMWWRINSNAGHGIGRLIIV